MAAVQVHAPAASGQLQTYASVLATSNELVCKYANTGGPQLERHLAPGAAAPGPRQGGPPPGASPPPH